jgi:hypothetical protein
MEITFSLDDFEQLVYSQAHNEAALMLSNALILLHQKRGALDGDFRASGMIGLPPDAQRERFCTRLVSAITTLFSNPDFRPSQVCFRLLLTLHEWIGMLFSVTPFGNADHIMLRLNPRGPDDKRFLPGDTFIEKLCLLYSIDSELELDLAALWNHDKAMAACLALVLLAPVFQGSANGHLKREALLQWLPGKLRQIDDLDDLPTAVLHNAYMFCSYADTPQRHAIKRDINVLLRRKLEQLGLTDLPVPPARQGARNRSKPLMIVVTEWFGGAHSIYRTHSRTIEAAREHFEVVGFGFGYAVDDIGRAVFDRFIELEDPDYLGQCVQTIRDFALAEQPDVLYMPSIGMFMLTVALSNLRIAPLQIAALGHPATTHSDKIDYISVEEDYVGDPSCFSERLLKLPKDGQPYRASSALPEVTHRQLERREIIRIVVTASPMKLNPPFLAVCRQIQERAGIPVQFHFMPGAGSGMPLLQIRRVIGDAVPGAIVHGFHAYAGYLAQVDNADLFLSPFPFGNTNGIVDAFTLGVPGVCKTGPEVFEHIDGALFARAGMPAWTTTDSVESYIEAAVRMITQHDEREALRKQLIDTKAVERFFEGRPDVFGKRVLRLVREQMRQQMRLAQETCGDYA